LLSFRRCHVQTQRDHGTCCLASKRTGCRCDVVAWRNYARGRRCRIAALPVSRCVSLPANPRGLSGRWARQGRLVPRGRHGSDGPAPAVAGPYCSCSRRSSAFAAGQVRRQVTPEGAYSSSTVPSTLRSAISCITTVPNLRRDGGDTGGPSRSVQLVREGLSLGPPADMQEASILRERPVFSGIGGKFVERKTDGLRRSCIQTQLGAAHHDTRTNEIGERGELGANQILAALFLLRCIGA